METAKEDIGGLRQEAEGFADTLRQTVSRLEDAGNLISIGKSVVTNLLGGGGDVSKNGLMSRFHPDLFDNASHALGHANRALDDSVEAAGSAAQYAEEYGGNV